MTDALISTTAATTEIPSYLLLREMGYDVWREEWHDNQEAWIATGPAGRFQSLLGLPGLLGLVRLAEIRGVDWPAPDAEIEAFLARFYPAARPRTATDV
jgi:hypothetical protein